MVNRLIRQDDLKLNIPNSVAIAGVGGIGSWVALFLAQVGVKELHLFDPDKIEDHNLNRTPFKESQVESLKVEALKELLQERRSDLSIFIYPYKFSSELLLSNNINWVVDATDNYKDQLDISTCAKKNKISYVRAGSKEHHITLTSEIPNGWDTKVETPEGVCGLSISQWISPQVITAALTVSYICTGYPRKVSLDIRSLDFDSKHK